MLYFRTMTLAIASVLLVHFDIPSPDDEDALPSGLEPPPPSAAIGR